MPFTFCRAVFQSKRSVLIIVSNAVKSKTTLSNPVNGAPEYGSFDISDMLIFSMRFSRRNDFVPNASVLNY